MALSFETASKQQYDKGRGGDVRIAELQMELEIADLQIELLRAELNKSKYKGHSESLEDSGEGSLPSRPPAKSMRSVSDFIPPLVIALIRRVRQFGLPLERKRQMRLLSESDLFDGVWYSAVYPDTKRSFLTPEEHYLLAGASEGRDPSPNFSSLDFFYRNPELTGKNVNPLLEHLRQNQ